MRSVASHSILECRGSSYLALLSKEFRWLKDKSSQVVSSDPRLVRFGKDAAHKHVTTWFRSQFEVPDLKIGEHLVLLLCVDDGAVVYLNGEELGRINMPKGQISAETLTLQAIGPSSEGFYVRLQVPPGRLRPRRETVLAVEVHQATVTSSDLFFDLELKVSHPHIAIPEIADAAWEVTNTYLKNHYAQPG